MMSWQFFFGLSAWPIRTIEKKKKAFFRWFIIPFGGFLFCFLFSVQHCSISRWQNLLEKDEKNFTTSSSSLFDDWSIDVCYHNHDHHHHQIIIDHDQLPLFFYLKSFSVPKTRALNPGPRFLSAVARPIFCIIMCVGWS